MIKNIIFDIGNVIMQNPTIDVVKCFFKNEKDIESFYNYIFKSNYWKMMDLGQISNDEIAKEIESKKLVDVSDFNEAKNFMNNWFSKCIPNQETMKLAEKLKKKGYKLYILSNIANSTFEYFSKTYNFFSIVDGAVISAKVGVKKPDKKIFDVLIEKYSLNPDECLLIDDDDTNKTFETANSIGIKGRRVIPNNVDDIIVLLKENGIELS